MRCAPRSTAPRGRCTIAMGRELSGTRLPADPFGGPTLEALRLGPRESDALAVPHALVVARPPLRLDNRLRFAELVESCEAGPRDWGKNDMFLKFR